MVTYLATVHKDPDSDYGVQFYDFPGCITAGSTTVFSLEFWVLAI